MDRKTRKAIKKLIVELSKQYHLISATVSDLTDLYIEAVTIADNASKKGENNG